MTLDKIKESVLNLRAIVLCMLFIPTVVLSTGCGAKGVFKFWEDTYPDILKQHTHKTSVHEVLEVRLMIEASLLGPALRNAYVKEYSKRFELNREDRHELLAHQNEENNKYVVFFVSTYTPEEDWNDFTDRDSIWRFYLTDGKGQRVEPLNIEVVDERDPVIRDFYPYLDPWTKPYRILFPRYSSDGVPMGQGNSLVLTVTGLKGKAELEWDDLAELGVTDPLDYTPGN